MVYENNIDWIKIFKEYQFYQEFDFKNLNVDWTIDSQYVSVTKPEINQKFMINDLELIGSAEQTFIKLIDEGKLEHGRFMALTPCFRYEPMIDQLHRQYFMKLELIQLASVYGQKYLHEIIDICSTFFGRYVKVDVIEIGKNQFDIIEIKTGIELGSYGIREWKNKEWVYATGIAEPRLSSVINILNSEFSKK